MAPVLNLWPGSMLSSMAWGLALCGLNRDEFALPFLLFVVRLMVALG